MSFYYKTKMLLWGADTGHCKKTSPEFKCNKWINLKLSFCKLLLEQKLKYTNAKDSLITEKRVNLI